MIAAKLYTSKEGGRWKKINDSLLDKQKMTQWSVENHQPIIFSRENGGSIMVYSVMFEDGTICDIGNNFTFRPESAFHKDETIEYMNKILNGEI